MTGPVMAASPGAASRVPDLSAETPGPVPTVPGAPAELMSHYARQDAQRGRNEPCTCGSGRKWKHCHGAEPAR